MSTSAELRKIDDEVGTDEESPEVSLDDEKVFTARGVVLSRDGFANFIAKHDHKNEVGFTNPVPVKGFDMGDANETKDGGTAGQVGFANLHWEGGSLFADVTMPYSSQERLLIETNDVFAESTFIGNGPDKPVELRDLWLTMRRPSDSSETPLKPVA